MALFGRKKAPDTATPVEEVEASDAPAGQPGVDREWERRHDGPFDITEREPESAAMDFGPLKIPTARSMELRLEVERGTSKVVGVTLGAAGSLIQIQVFAAPRSQGLWQEIRSEITQGVRERGGTADLHEGRMGTEIIARIPTQAADGRSGFQQARFFGVDGPRWFLRVAVNGPAAAHEAALEPVIGLIREIIVDRGDEPMPPREVLALTPPPKVLEAIATRAAALKAEQEGASSDTSRAGDSGGVASTPDSSAPGSTPEGSPPDTSGR